MELADKLRALDVLVYRTKVNGELYGLCRERMRVGHERYGGRDIETRDVHQEITEELADAVNIAAMGERMGALGRADAAHIAEYMDMAQRLLSQARRRAQAAKADKEECGHNG
jgi:hypothetical protein